MKVVWFLALLLLALDGFAKQTALPSANDTVDDGGEVRVPLSVYQQMWQLLNEDPRPPQYRLPKLRVVVHVVSPTATQG